MLICEDTTTPTRWRLPSYAFVPPAVMRSSRVRKHLAKRANSIFLEQDEKEQKDEKLEKLAEDLLEVLKGLLAKNSPRKAPTR